MFARSLKFGATLLLLFASHALASTISITYQLVNVGGSTYDYIYTVGNNGSLPGGEALQLFDINFDPTLYNSLQIVTPPSFQSNWFEEILPAGGGLPALYDVCATPLGNNTCPTTSGITTGNSLSGFSVQFTWLGSGTPGSQQFEVYDPNNNYQEVQQGTTSLGSSVPEPATFGLVALALGLAGRKIRRGRF